MRKALRSVKQLKRYRDHIKNGGLEGSCVMCVREPLKEFTHWKIIKNNFPYDRVAVVHHMIVPKRHVKERELTKEETDEYDFIKDNYIHTSYDKIMEATNRTKSVPEHFHIHLILEGRNQ